MKLLIDSDTIAFASAASAENEEFWVAQARCDEMVNTILQGGGATEYELWLTGANNFRYQVYSEYKANRKESVPPKWYAPLKDHLAASWGAQWSDGCEADDMLGVRSFELTNEKVPHTLAHIDKDINMIPGWHFSWEIRRLGKVVKPAQLYEVTEEEALYNFYYQLIVGDTTDNIKGVRGAGPVAAIKLLHQHPSEEERFRAISDMYSCYEEMALNARCLWIWRKMNDDVTERWSDWMDGQMEESMVSL